MSMAEKLVSLRKQKGLTQMDLAEQLNVSRQAISRWEVGAAVPSTDNLKVLGDLYGVSVDYLLDDRIKNSDNCDSIENTKQDDPCRNNKKQKTILIAVVFSLILGALIWASVRRNDENIPEVELPMENMTVEEAEDNSLVTLPLE